MAQIEKENLIYWLEKQEQTFNDFLNEVRKNKLKALNPKTQGQIMASAGVIAFIHAEIDYLNSLNSDTGHGKE